MHSEGEVGNVPDFNVIEESERLHDMFTGDAHKAES